MASVYGSSLVTIAVLHSADSRGGCFLERQRRAFNSSLTAGISTESIPVVHRMRDIEYTTMTRVKHSEPHNRLLGIYTRRLPLETRAWALQERLLSPRTLLIHSEELLWECRSAIDCECGSILTDDNHTFREIYMDDSLKMKIQPWNNRDIKTGSRNWRMIVEEYSQLSLTKPEDVQQAMAGLVDHFSHFMTGQCVAGIWIHDLPLGLRWRSWLPIDRSDTSLPSWSWMSVCSGDAQGNSVDNQKMNGIDYGKYDNRFAPDSDFTFVSCDTASLSAPAIIHLRISGLVFTIKLSEQDAQKSKELFKPLGRAKGEHWSFASDIKLAPVSGDVSCLLLGSATSDMGHVYEYLLALTTTASPACTPTYRRIGLLKTTSWAEDCELFNGNKGVLMTLDII